MCNVKIIQETCKVCISYREGILTQDFEKVSLRFKSQSCTGQAPECCKGSFPMAAPPPAPPPPQSPISTPIPHNLKYRFWSLISLSAAVVRPHSGNCQHMVNVRGIHIAILAADSVGAVQVGLGEGAPRARLRQAARQRRHLALH